jgi:hypothetical protein
MRGPKHRTGMPRFLLSFVALILIASLVAGYFLFQPHPSSSSSTSLSSNASTENQPPVPLRSAVSQFLYDFNQRNVAGLSKLYDYSATVIWSGQGADGLAGAYAGTSNIQILYGSTIGKTSELNATMSNYKEAATSPSNVNATLTLRLSGNSTTLGAINGTIDVSQDWVFSGGQWQIIKENWNYKTFDVQFPQSATTFPQWGALRTGKNPDLVSEKSFEWKAGPVVAASVYAFMFAVIAFALLSFLNRWRDEPRRRSSR